MQAIEGGGGYLHFIEDEFVPQAVVPDDAFLHLCVLPVHSKVQEPLLKRGFGATLNLRGGRRESASAGGSKRRETRRSPGRRRGSGAEARRGRLWAGAFSCRLAGV